MFLSQKVGMLPTNPSILNGRNFPPSFLFGKYPAPVFESAPYTVLETLNSDLYAEECLKKHLLPFNKKHMPKI